MKRILLPAFTAVMLLALSAHAQEVPIGDQYIAKRISQDTLAIKQLLEENAALKAQIAKRKAEDDKKVAEPTKPPSPMRINKKAP